MEKDNYKIVFEKAFEVLGDNDSVEKWLTSPVPALNYAIPITLIDTDDGFKQVMNTLLSIEHGVYQ